MRISVFILAFTSLILANICAGIAFASTDTDTKDPDTAKTTDSSKDKSKKISLAELMESREQVMFLAKRKFSIADTDYNMLLGDTLSLVEEEYKYKDKQPTEAELAKLEQLRDKVQKLQKQILQDDYNDYLQYIKDNEYFKTTGWSNVEKGGGVEISIMGLATVFSGLFILVILLIFFGKIFSRKAPQTDVITIEMDDSPVRESSQSQVKRKVSTILIRKDKISQRAKAIAASENVEEGKDQKMKEIAVAIAMAIHAELHLYAKSEKITVLDYPNVVSSWAFSTRPAVNSHFQQLRRK